MKSIRKQLEACFAGSRKAEAARDEVLLRAIFEHLPVGIWIVDPSGKILHANPEAIRIWGGARYDSILELTYRAWFAKSGKESEVADRPSYVSLTSREAVLGVEVEIEASDGARRRIVTSSVPLFSPSHEFLGVVVMNYDVTARREAEDELHRSHEWFRTLIEHSNEIISTISEDGTILFATQPVDAVLGFRAQEWVGRSIFELMRPAHAERAREHLAKQRRTDEPMCLEIDAVDARGIWRTLEVFTSRYVPDDGQVQIITNSRDITERNAMTRALEQATRLGALGRVAATIAHEINNVLMSIQPSVEVVARLTRGEPRLDAASDRIMHGVRRGKRITSEILRFARTAQPQFALLNVSDLFATVRPELQSLLPESIALDAHAPPEDLWMSADKVQMEQVVTNLVINARDAIPDGGAITIAAAALDDWLQITVGDTGEGIPEENLDRIFEPLFTTKAGGTGLGLAVVQQIVVRHGGSINAESEVGRGTTFTIAMPLASDRAARKEEMT